MAIITAEQFREKSNAIIQIPGFDPGEVFDIKVRKLSLVGLISSGKIPNSLMKVVKDAFAGLKSSVAAEVGDDNAGSNKDSDVIDKAGDIGKLLNIVCAEAMLEPKFEDVKDVMNDAQMLAVFQFTQGGVQAVEPFPAVEGDTRHPDDVENVSSQTE